MSLRILHVTPYSSGAWAYGGIPRVTSTLTHELARLGHDVTVCTTDACDRSRRLPPSSSRWSARPSEIVDEGVLLRVFPNVSNRLAYHAQCFTPIGMSRFLRDHGRDFDVAHLHACRNAPGVIAARHLREAGVPYVLAPNGTAPRLERRYLAKRLVDALWSNRVTAEAAAVLAVSSPEADQLVALGVPKAKIARIPNPVDLDEYRNTVPRGCLRRRFDLGPGPIVLYLGKLTPRKRVDLLILAFAKLGRPDARLVIAGNDMGSGASLRRLVRSLGLGGQTTFTGLLEGRARLEALADADVTAYPSEHEVFGLVAPEAILAGSPVVVADDSGCGALVAGLGGGLVVPQGSVGALASAIESVLTDPTTWEAEIEAAGRRVRATYGARIVAEQVEALYEELCRRATRVPSRHRKPTPEDPGLKSGVSFVIPVRNGAPWLEGVVRSIRRQADGRPMEILAIDDGSEDGSDVILRELADECDVRVIKGDGRGAAAAINLGVRHAAYPIVCQVDQDVTLHSGWLTALAAEFADPSVAAAQGYYTSDRHASLAARVMALDLEQRYAALRDRFTDHVCTGNTAYRVSAVREVGGLDERMGYGYDNDLSYRLRAAGYRLIVNRSARSTHAWRDGLAGYCRQQYGFGYGRLELVAKHPSRIAGDAVSPASMMLHPAVMLVAVVAGIGSAALAGAGGPWRPLALGAGLLVAGLAAERLIAGARAAVRFRDPAAWLFPIAHLVRDLAWVAACATWAVRRLTGRRAGPGDSMRPRPAATVVEPRPLPTAIPAGLRVLGLIPAHNEAFALPSVIAEMRARCPSVDVLIIDDGSTDDTPLVLDALDVRWIRFPVRMGIGSAMRAGLRYAAHLRYDAAVRLDGDGQHRADDIACMLEPIADGRADVVLGSRFVEPSRRSRGLVGLVQSALAFCLSRITGRPVTDPTSGFCAIGRRTMHLLAEHHPTGYPEAELRLFLSRNRLTAVEVPIRPRRRQGGRTSLTPARLTSAGLRVLLAMLIVPWRSIVGTFDAD